MKAGKNGKQVPSLLQYGNQNRLHHILSLALDELHPHCSPMVNINFFSLNVNA